ncbi:MAG: Ig-like domain-containing protein, partial [Gammaproteobacteria bacterium]|nr:Ig-like domain-containing protein [Gammaproteobacteria bacterium]
MNFLFLITSCGGGEGTPSVNDSFAIISVQPDEGSSTAAVDTEIVVTFNNPVNESKVSKNTFYLVDEHSHQKVDSEISLSTDKHSIILTPKALFFERHYEVIVHHTITDETGKHIAAGTKDWEFFTQEKPAIFDFQPEPGATGVNTRA